ncbi:hypothetical protein [Roseburia hominis]
MESEMFNFRIIDTADGNQIIDRNLKTPYEALTPLQMVEYTEMDNRFAFMDRVERKAKQKAEQMRKLAKNPLYKMACMVGLI